MDTKKYVKLSEKYRELRMAWLDKKYKTKDQKDELIQELLELFHEALQG